MNPPNDKIRVIADKIAVIMNFYDNPISFASNAEYGSDFALLGIASLNVDLEAFFSLLSISSDKNLSDDIDKLKDKYNTLVDNMGSIVEACESNYLNNIPCNTSNGEMLYQDLFQVLTMRANKTLDDILKFIKPK